MTDGDEMGLVGPGVDRRQFLRAMVGAGIASSLGYYASDTATAQSSGGEEVWRFGTGGPVFSSPTVVDDTVFVGSDEGSFSGSVYALDASSGEQIWSFETNLSVGSSPTVVDEKVFLGSNDGSVYALDAETGEELWSSEVGNEVQSSPTVVEGTVFVGSDAANFEGTVYALDASSGEQIWNFETESGVQSSPTVVDSTVFVGTGGGSVLALDTSSGDTEWSFEAGASVESSPTVANGILYIGTADGTVYALDSSSGEELWSAETGIGVRSSPTVFDGTVFFGSWDNNVYALDVENGNEEWSFETGGSVWSSPTVVEETVFVGSDDGNLYALDTSTGDEEWVFEISDSSTSVGGRASSSVRSSPTVAGGTVFVGSDDGNLYAVDTGVSGSSEGSRTNLGTLGHHGNWEHANQSIGIEEDVNDEEAANFEVSIDGTNSPVEEDEPIRAEVTVTNVGAETGTQTVTAEITEVGSDSATISLDGGSSTTENLTISKSSDDTGSHIVEVSTEDESVSTSVTIEEPEENDPDNEQESESGAENPTDESPVENDTDSNEEGGNDTEAAPTETGTGTGSGMDLPLTVAQISALGGGIGLALLSAVYILKNSGDDDVETSEDRMKKEDVRISGEATPISDTKPKHQRELDLSDADYDDFEKVEKIGSGGSGDVYKTRYDGETVALKTPRMTDDETLDRSMFDEFMSEAEVWNGIDDHERIVSIYAWGDHPLPWIAVEYMEEGDLTAQSLSNKEVFAELEGLCEGLYHAHRHGVTHTDIKPENILYTSVGGKKVGKLTDWGMANELLEHSMSVKGFTPSYSAPEQFEPEQYGGTDEKTDIYQLGVVTYELFTGELPYRAGSHGQAVNKVLNQKPTPPTQIDSSVTEELEQALLKALAKNKKDRHETALHFRDDLRRAFNSRNER